MKGMAKPGSDREKIERIFTDNVEDESIGRIDWGDDIVIWGAGDDTIRLCFDENDNLIFFD